MLRRYVGTLPGAALALVVACLLTPAQASAQSVLPSGPSCGSGGCASCGVGTTQGSRCGLQCCTPYRYCAEGPVHIHFHRGCAKPVCNPCELPHFGYYQTCWTPWPHAPDWSHCVATPPAATVLLHPPAQGPALSPARMGRPQNPTTDADDDAPAPRDGIRPGL